MPVPLAVHYSPALDALWPRLGSLVDLVKVGPWTDPAVFSRYQGRCLLHGIADGFILSAHEPPTEPQWQTLRELIAATGTPWLSDHIAFACADARVHFQDGLVTVTGEDLLDEGDTLSAIIKAIDAIEGRTNRRFLGENLDYVDVLAYRYITDPAFISEVVRLSGCDLLLDTAHARVAADWLGLGADTYLDRLPIERTREVHFNGPLVRDGRLWDAHAPATDEDYRLLASVLERVRPDAVTLEYRGGELEHEVRQLAAFLAQR